MNDDHFGTREEMIARYRAMQALLEQAQDNRSEWHANWQKAKADLAECTELAEALCERLASDHPVDQTVGAALPQEIYDFRSWLKKKAKKKEEWAWECNECGSQEYSMAVSEADVNNLGCSNCGGDEWHKARAKS